MTVQEVLEAAYAKSTKNNPGTIATESVELLGVVQRALDGAFAVAARVNPYYFGESATVAGAGGSWARPVTAESIFRIEDASDNSEVVIVGFNDPEAESAKAAVYEYGQQFYPAGNAPDPDPALDSLIFYYSKAPTDLTATGDALDALFPESFNELIVLHVARYLAIKDSETEGRAAEVAVLADEINRWANRFVAHLEHSSLGLRKRWGHINRFNSPSVVPIMSIIGAAALGETK